MSGCLNYHKCNDMSYAMEKYTKAMSKIMISVGTMVAKQIDELAHKQCPTYPKNKLQDVIRLGNAHVGRLLHYFPFNTKENVEDDWCGWHNDHGALTALTSSMYIDKDGKELKFKETKGGLFAKNRFSETAKISIPADMLAFQLGESTQIMTGGMLEATPHCVVRSDELAGKGVSRNTFALFMEPDDLYPMSVPKSRNPSSAINKDTHKVPPL